MMAAAVNCLVIEPTQKTVSASLKMLFSLIAIPYPVIQNNLISLSNQSCTRESERGNAFQKFR
jgi:hypothetical protein